MNNTGKLTREELETENATLRALVAEAVKDRDRHNWQIGQIELRVHLLERVSGLTALRERVAALEGALRSFLHLTKNSIDDASGDDALTNLPDSHPFELMWGRDGSSYPQITVGQIKRARAALSTPEQKEEGTPLQWTPPENGADPLPDPPGWKQATAEELAAHRAAFFKQKEEGR